METNYSTLRMSKLTALMRERGLWGYSRLRLDGLIAFLQDSVKMKTNYDALRLVELRALVREHGLRGYYRLKKAELIAFLCDNIQPTPAKSVRPKPPKLMRPPPPPPEDLFNPYEMGRTFRRDHRSFRINGRSRMDVETFLNLEEVLLT